MKTRSQAKKDSTRDKSPTRKLIEQDKSAATSLKNIGENYGEEAVDLTARLFYYHVHVNGTYTISLPSRDSARDYIKQIVAKWNGDSNPEINEGREHLTYFAETSTLSFIQAMNLPANVAHLIPKPLTLPSSCTGSDCATIVTILLDKMCTVAGCTNLLCKVCCTNRTCVKHTSP